MSDPRIDPNYRGQKCPGCGERLPFLLTELCSYCTHERDQREIERLIAENERLRATLERIANKHHLPSVYQYIAREALDKLREGKNEKPRQTINQLVDKHELDAIEARFYKWTNASEQQIDDVAYLFKTIRNMINAVNDASTDRG